MNDQTHVPIDELDALLGTGSGRPDTASAAWWGRFLDADPGAARAARTLLAQLRGSRIGQARLDRTALTQVHHLLRSIYAYVQRTGDLLPADGGSATAPRSTRRGPATSRGLAAGI